MKTLLERLKPEFKLKLEDNRKQYSFSIDLIYSSLQKNYSYSDLTIGEIRSLVLFSDLSTFELSVWDIKYGDRFFNENAAEHGK